MPGFLSHRWLSMTWLMSQGKADSEYPELEGTQKDHPSPTLGRSQDTPTTPPGQRTLSQTLTDTLPCSYFKLSNVTCSCTKAEITPSVGQESSGLVPPVSNSQFNPTPQRNSYFWLWEANVATRRKPTPMGCFGMANSFCSQQLVVAHTLWFKQ